MDNTESNNEPNGASSPQDASEELKASAEAPDSAGEPTAAEAEGTQPQPESAEGAVPDEEIPPPQIEPQEAAQAHVEETRGRSKPTAGDAPSQIARILDLELPVSVSFGSALRPLSDVLELKTGMVLELDTEAEDGALLKVNQKVFAKGEVVEVAGHYGLRITEIESKSQRLSALEGNG